MRFFDWFLRKQRGSSRISPRPKVLSGLDDDSLQVVVDMDGVNLIIDRENFEYLYGDNNAPNPAQRDLDELLPNVTRVRAIASGMFRGKPMSSEVVLDTSDPKALSDFCKTLQIVEDPATFSHCGCLGGPTLELFSGENLIATIGLQHGRAIRWSRWKHDANLCQGQALNDWLTRNGVEEGFLDVLLHNQYDAAGMMPLGVLRSGSSPLSRAEQRIRLAELMRVRGGNLEEALAECQTVLDAEPELGFGYAIRGLIHSQRQDHSRCVDDCTKAINLGVVDAYVYYSRAVALDHLGLADAALADCTSAIEIEPKLVNALNSRGLIRTRLGLLNEALADFEEAIRMAPKWSLPYLNRGQTHVARNDLDAAIADYTHFITITEQSGKEGEQLWCARAYANRGQVYRMKGDMTRAVADFEVAERVNKTHLEQSK